MAFSPAPYVPNKAVEMAHAIPRLYFTPISFESFDISQKIFPISNQTISFLGNEPITAIGDALKGDQTQKFANQARYLAGLVSLPVCLIILGILSLLIFQLCLSCRCFCKCLKCAPHEDEIENNPKKIIVARNKIVWGFWLFFLCMLAADGCLYIGNEQLQIGSGNVVKAAKSLKEIFLTLIAEANNMATNSGTIKTIVQSIAAGNCGTVQSNQQSAVNNMQTAVNVMQAAFTAISDMLTPIPDLLDTAITNTELYGQDLKTKALYVLFGIIIVVALLFLVGACYASKWALYLGTLLGEIVVLYSTIICGVFMIFVTFLADFCVNPAVNLANLTPEMARDMVVFYSTCKGTDPFNADLTSMSTAVSDFGTSFSNSFGGQGGPCDQTGHQSYATDVASASSAIADSINVVNMQTDCEPLYTVYDKFLNKGLCGNLFAGFYDVWMCVCFTSVALYFLMCFSSVMWQYFGKAWKLRPDNVHTGGHMHLVGTHLVGTTPHAPVADTPSTGYKQEYTFTAAAPTAPALSRSDIEMI